MSKLDGIGSLPRANFRATPGVLLVVSSPTDPENSFRMTLDDLRRWLDTAMQEGLVGDPGPAGADADGIFGWFYG